MTDEAERQRRSRAHRRGDHRWCLPGRCAALQAAETPDDREGSTAEAMAAWSAALRIGADDPRRPMIEAALVLAGMVDRREAMPAAARELAGIVTWILDLGERGAQVDELRARRAGRRVEILARHHLDGSA